MENDGDLIPILLGTEPGLYVSYLVHFLVIRLSHVFRKYLLVWRKQRPDKFRPCSIHVQSIRVYNAQKTLLILLYMDEQDVPLSLILCANTRSCDTKITDCDVDARDRLAEPFPTHNHQNLLKQPNRSDIEKLVTAIGLYDQSCPIGDNLN